MLRCTEHRAAAGFYVLLDNHIREDQTVLQDPAEWARKWAALVRHPAPAFSLDVASSDPVSTMHALLLLLLSPTHQTW